MPSLLPYEQSLPSAGGNTGGNSLKRERIADIPKNQRVINRPSLSNIPGTDVVKDKLTRDAKIFEAVQKHGYSQKEVADHLGLYYSSVSRIMKRI